MVKSQDDKFLAGHRARLRQKLIEGKISDYELLELYLTYAIPRRDIRPLARSLFCRYGGIHQIVNTPFKELLKFKGLGEYSSTLLLAVHELTCIEYRAQLKEAQYMNNQKILENFCRMLVRSKPVEECHVLYMGPKKLLICDEIHSRGTNDWTPIFAKDIMMRCLELKAKYIVMVHNHPSGNPEPSQEDVEWTQLVISKIAAADTELIDHFIVAGDILVSMRAKQLLNKSGDVTNNV